MPDKTPMLAFLLFWVQFIVQNFLKRFKSDLKRFKNTLTAYFFAHPNPRKKSSAEIVQHEHFFINVIL